MSKLKNSEYEKMRTGQWYFAGDKESIAPSRVSVDVFKFNHTSIENFKQYDKAQRKLVNAKNGLFIAQPFTCEFGLINAGKNFFVSAGCCFLDGGSITFGDNVLIGPNVVITTASHPEDVIARSLNYCNGKPINIGNNVWIGANATILQGVTIGNNSIIAAGSVVTKDLPPNVIAMGVPAKAVREIKPEEEFVAIQAELLKKKNEIENTNIYTQDKE